MPSVSLPSVTQQTEIWNSPIIINAKLLTLPVGDPVHAAITAQAAPSSLCDCKPVLLQLQHPGAASSVGQSMSR